jgi:hypothetical protein
MAVGLEEPKNPHDRPLDGGLRRVYIAVERTPFEGAEVISVNGTREGAERAADARNRKTGDPFCSVVEYVIGP